MDIYRADAIDPAVPKLRARLGMHQSQVLACPVHQLAGNTAATRLNARIAASAWFPDGTMMQRPRRERIRRRQQGSIGVGDRRRLEGPAIRREGDRRAGFIADFVP